MMKKENIIHDLTITKIIKRGVLFVREESKLFTFIYLYTFSYLLMNELIFFVDAVTAFLSSSSNQDNQKRDLNE